MVLMAAFLSFFPFCHLGLFQWCEGGCYCTVLFQSPCFFCTAVVLKRHWRLMCYCRVVDDFRNSCYFLLFFLLLKNRRCWLQWLNLVSQNFCSKPQPLIAEGRAEAQRDFLEAKWEVPSWIPISSCGKPPRSLAGVAATQLEWGGLGR